MKSAFGAAFVISGMIDFMMPTLVLTKSKRLCPGFLPTPEVMTTMSELIASEYSPA